MSRLVHLVQKIFRKKINQDSDDDTTKCWGDQIYEDGAQIYDKIRGVAILIYGSRKKGRRRKGDKVAISYNTFKFINEIFNEN